MKKLISLLVVVAMMAACLGTIAFAADETKITVETVDGARGEEVTVAVSIEGNPGFAATKMTLDFDTTALELVKIEVEGMLLEGAAVNNEKGIVSFAKATNVTKDGVLMTVTFKVKAEATGCGFDVKVIVNNLTSADQSEVTYTAENGTVGTEHAYGEWYEVEAATCTKKGLEQRDCLYCDASETRETNTIDHMHDGEWKFDEVGHWHECDVCAEHLSYGEHTYGEGVEGENGWTVFTCTVCGHEKYEEPAPTGDVSAIFFALTAVSGTGLVTLVAKKKED